MSVGEAEVGDLYVRLEAISKSFGGVRALDDVTIDFHDGEIHGLLGENGSGKSTLIKILAGFHQPDSGSIAVRGQKVDLPMKPGQYRSLGFAFVHQDLALVPSLSVVENVRLDRIAAARSFYINWKEQERLTGELFERFHAPWISPRSIVGDLRPIDRALVAIVRALSRLVAGEHEDQRAPGSLLVLDEPTAFLSREETGQLIRTLREISVQGTSVVFVSHKLREVLDLTHRVTVLRDGRVAGSRPTQGTSEGDLTRLVLGREINDSTVPEQVASARSRRPDTPLVELRGFALANRVQQLDLAIPGGQVLGLTGLEGTGFEEILYALFGLSTHRPSGQLSVAGQVESLDRLNPELAMTLGIALVPGDRQAQGCISTLSIRENLASPTLKSFWAKGHLSWRRIGEVARRLADEFDIRPRDVSREVSTLSGGNQQKVLLAKWLQTKPAVLLLHEPTQGVDVGARAQIFRFIKEAVTRENCVIVASTDYEQLEQLCTRVLVIGDGQIKASLSGSEVTQDRISEECLMSSRALAGTGGDPL